MKKETKICQFCGKEYTRPDNVTLSNWGKRKFCSMKCAALAKQARAERIFLPKKCEHCGKELAKRENEHNNAYERRRFCNQSCATRHKHSGSEKNKKRTFNIYINKMSDVMRHLDK